MTAKEYLERIRLLDEKISQKIWEREDLERKRTLISAIDYSRKRISGSKSGESPFEKTSDKLIDLSREIDCEIEAFTAERHKIINQIHGLVNHKFAMVLYERYVMYKDFKCIAAEMNYTNRYVQELCSKALANFEETYMIS